MDFESFRLQFPVVDQLAYLNHAAVSPLPLRCQQRMSEYLHELSYYGAAHYPGQIFKIVERARTLGAELMLTDPSQVFFVRSTTQGLGIAATGIPFRAGDNVVLVEHEFPANIRPWLPLRRQGVEVRFAPQRSGRVMLDDLVELVDGRTRAVSLSFVQFLSGFRADLAAVAELCRRWDALLVVDAIQGLGVFSLDVEELGVDFLAADAHKWLLGPEGAGLGYISPRALERIEPALEGWLSVENPFDFFDTEQPLKGSAARFEEGAYNLAGICGMLGSLELITTLGQEAIEARVLELTDLIVERLLELGWTVHSPRDVESEKSGIVLAGHPDLDAEALKAALAEQGVAVSVRGGSLRVSPHAYNTTEELERLFEVVREF